MEKKNWASRRSHFSLSSNQLMKEVRLYRMKCHRLDTPCPWHSPKNYQVVVRMLERKNSRINPGSHIFQQKTTFFQDYDVLFQLELPRPVPLGQLGWSCLVQRHDGCVTLRSPASTTPIFEWNVSSNSTAGLGHPNVSTDLQEWSVFFEPTKRSSSCEPAAVTAAIIGRLL